MIPDVASHGGTDQISSLIDVPEKAEPAVQGLQDDLENIGKNLVSRGGQKNVGDPIEQFDGALLSDKRLFRLLPLSDVAEHHTADQSAVFRLSNG